MSAFAKIGLLTVVGILSFTATILTAIFGLSDRFPTWLLIVSLISAAITWWVVKAIIRLNTQHLDGLKTTMREPSEFIAEWECSALEWKWFIDEQLADKSNAKTTALVSGSIVGFMFIFLFSLQFTWLIAILGGIGVFVAFGGLIYWLFDYFGKRKFAKFAASPTGKVVLSKKTIQLNHHIIDWSMKFYSLSSVYIDESLKYPVMHITIETNTANGTGYTTHLVPVPPSKLEEAHKIADYYLSGQ